MSTFWLIIAVIIMLVGVVGSLLPIIPGTILMGLTVFWFGWVDGFTRLPGGWAFVLIAISLIAGTADIWLPMLGAKSGGAAPQSIAWGILGAVVGFIAGSIIPVAGSLIGSLIGYLGAIYLSEYRRIQDSRQSLKAVIGGVAGWGLATVIQFIAAIFILVTFLIVVL